MTMRKKDYEAIARAIVYACRDINDKEPFECVPDMVDGAKLAAEHIADYCATQDPTFKRDRFLADCGVSQS